MNTRIIDYISYGYIVSLAIDSEETRWMVVRMKKGAIFYLLARARRTTIIAAPIKMIVPPKML